MTQTEAGASTPQGNGAVIPAQPLPSDSATAPPGTTTTVESSTDATPTAAKALAVSTLDGEAAQTAAEPVREEDAVTAPEPEGDAEAEAESEADAALPQDEAATSPGNEDAVAAEVGAQPEAVSAAEPADEPDAAAEPDAGSDAEAPQEAVDESEAEPAAEPDPATEALVEPHAWAEAETEAQVDEQAGAAESSSAEPPDADAETDVVAQPQTDVDADAEPADDAEPVAEAEPQPVVAAASVLSFRERMAAVQLQFDQAPAEAVAQAELVFTDAVAALHGVLLKNAADLGRWRQSKDPEELRSALQRYHQYLDKVLSAT